MKLLKLKISKGLEMSEKQSFSEHTPKSSILDDSKIFQSKTIIFLLAFSLFLTACEPEQIPDKDKPIDDKNIPADVECTSDSDCITGGCSGTVCQSKNAEPIFTTCEWREEYDCYKQVDCGCVNGKCEWEKTKAFEDCVDKARI